MRRFAHLATAVCSALCGVGTASASPPELPPYTMAYEPQTVDERGMWMVADEHEQRMRQSPLLVRDEALHGYIRRVLCETVGDDRCNAVRIYIAEVPAFNATMHPNGVLTVWTGLLLRVRSEAELAAVLGHEFAHFELRHSLAGFQRRRSATDAMAWVQVLGAMGNVDTRSSQISLIGSIYSYNREQESAADLLGQKYMARSAYPSMAAANVWRNVMAEADATAAGRKLKSKKRYTAGFFDTHPTDLSRATVLQAQAAVFGDEDDPRGFAHYAAIRPHLARFLSAQVRLNDFGGTGYLLGSIETAMGVAPELTFARAELHQQRGLPRDLATASDLYRVAIGQGLTTPVVHRNLGITLMKSGFSAEARTQLEEYLKRAPDADDAAVIKTLIGQ